MPVWRVDPSHSELSFTIRHLAGRVRGTIAIWQGDIAADPANLGRSAVAVNAYPGSIDTGNRERDEHLRGPDFFDVTVTGHLGLASGTIRFIATYAADLTPHLRHRPDPIPAPSPAPTCGCNSPHGVPAP